MRTTYVECQCVSPWHVLRVQHDNEDCWVEFACQPRTLWERVKGLFRKDHVFVDCLLHKHEARKLAFAVDPDLGLELLSALGQEEGRLLTPADIGSKWKYWDADENVYYYTKIVDVGCRYVVTESLEKGFEHVGPEFEKHETFVRDYERAE